MNWCSEHELNVRHETLQDSALPTELPLHNETALPLSYKLTALLRIVHDQLSGRWLISTAVSLAWNRTKNQSHSGTIRDRTGLSMASTSRINHNH